MQRVGATLGHLARRSSARLSGSRDATPARVRLFASALAVTATVGFGVLSYAFGVLLVPMVEELGWTNAMVSAGMSTGLLVSGLSAPLVGRTIDLHGARRVMLLGTVLGGIGLSLWSVARTLPTYFAAWVVIGVAMAMVLYEPAFAAVARHAPGRQRAAVLSITLLGGLASTIFIPITELLLGWLGWRGALVVLALLLVTLCAPLILIGVPRRGEVIAGVAATPAPPGPADVAPAAPARSDGPATDPTGPISLLHSSALRRLTAAMVLSRLATVGVAAHLVAFLIISGRPSAVAAGIASAVGVAKTFGRLAIGYAARRWTARTLLLVSLGAASIGLAAPLVSTNLAGDVVLVVAFGAGAGAVTVLRPLYMVDLFGFGGYGTTSGRMARVLRFSEAVAPIAIGGIVTLTGSSAPAWALLAVSSLLAVPILPRPQGVRSHGAVPERE